MSVRDLYNNLKAVVAINPTTGKDNLTGNLIDLQGFNGALVVVQSGTITDGTFTFELRHGNASDGSDLVAVPDEDLLGTEPVFAATDDNVVKQFGYIGTKRYIKLVATVSGSPTTGGTLGAVVIKGFPRHAPVS